jgi:hypothetical protein
MAGIGKVLFKNRLGWLLVEDCPGALSRHIWLSSDRLFRGTANEDEVELAKSLGVAVDALRVYARRVFWEFEPDSVQTSAMADQGDRARMALKKLGFEVEVKSPA